MCRRNFCDLAKTFDCVNQEILLAKLHFYGIQGVTADWFKSYLTNRGQKVEIKSPNSSKILSPIRVLQTSILGPLLLIICINNLPKRITSLLELILFANDTNILITTRKFEDFSSVSNLVLSHMIEWFKVNKFVLTLEKTNIIKFETLNSSLYALTTGYKDNYTEETVHICNVSCLAT